MSGTQVLLVDDDPEICRFLEMLLQIEGYAPRVATRAEEALAACEEQPPGAILVDIAMPEVDAVLGGRSLGLHIKEESLYVR